MNLIERLYNENLDRMTGPQRVARTCELLEGVMAMIEHQVRQEDPEVSDRELKLRTAEILYLNDPETQRLLQLMRADGPA